MRTSPRFAALFLLSALPLAGCSHRAKPAPPPPSPPPVAPSADQVTAPQRPALSDEVESPLAGDLVTANEHAYRTGLLGDVYFAYDEATLDDAARDRLAKNAAFFRAHPEFVVSIEGHCDERGTNEYNLALGERRAQASRDYVGTLGVAPTSLRTISFGEERPQCTEGAESCWSRNRRAHFVLVERIAAKG